MTREPEPPSGLQLTKMPVKASDTSQLRLRWKATGAWNIAELCLPGVTEERCMENGRVGVGVGDDNIQPELYTILRGRWRLEAGQINGAAAILH